MAVVEKNKLNSSSDVQDRPAGVPYSSTGHPSIEQLAAEQGTGPISDVSVLHGDFWPEDESIEDFLAALYEWRGHKRTDPAA